MSEHHHSPRLCNDWGARKVVGGYGDSDNGERKVSEPTIYIDRRHTHKLLLSKYSYLRQQPQHLLFQHISTKSSSLFLLQRFELSKLVFGALPRQKSFLLSCFLFVFVPFFFFFFFSFKLLLSKTKESPSNKRFCENQCRWVYNSQPLWFRTWWFISRLPRGLVIWIYNAIELGLQYLKSWSCCNLLGLEICLGSRLIFTKSPLSRILS